MSKPNWDDAPTWAQWLAQDFCGEWWWYERKPRHHRSLKRWVEDSAKGNLDRAGSRQPENDGWRETLERRP